MSFAYNIKDQAATHFLTFTIHQWADVFTRQRYVNIYLDSLLHCQQEWGLHVYGWVMMSNHVHLIVRAEYKDLCEIIRDHKKFTAKKIYESILTNEKESRKAWLSLVLHHDGHIRFWEEGYHGEAIYQEAFFLTKLKYLHENPVRAGLVTYPDQYLNSSAGDYSGTQRGRIIIFGL